MIKCIKCEQEHEEKFVDFDLIGDAWCVDCLNEELGIYKEEMAK